MSKPDEAALIASIDQMSVATDTPAPVEVAVVPAVADAPSTSVAAPAGPKLAALDDDALVELTIDGEKRQIPWKEARTGFMLHGAATKRFQEAAAIRTDAEQREAAIVAREQTWNAEKTQYATEQAQIAAILRDPDKLAVIYQAALAEKQGGAPTVAAAAATTINPDELIAKVREAATQAFDQRLTDYRRTQATEAMDSDLSTFAKSLIAEKPALGLMPNADEYLFGEVLKMKPSSPAQAKEYARIVAEGVQTNFNAAMAEHGKAAAASKAKAVGGIEPKGGQGITPQPRKYTGLDDPNLEADAIAYINAQMNGA